MAGQQQGRGKQAAADAAAEGAPAPDVAPENAEGMVPLSAIQSLLEDFEGRIVAAETRAAEAEARAAQAAPATGESLVLERLLALLEQGALGGVGGAQVFAPGESAVAVEKSLEGTTSDRLPEDDELDAPVTFMSRGANFALVRKARHRMVMPNGEVHVSDGVLLDFAPTGMFTTTSRQNVEYLRSRQAFNVEYWEVGNEPGKIPSPEGLYERVMQALLDVDDETLEALQREEEQGFRRAEVIRTIKVARAKVQGMIEVGAEA